MTSGQRTRVYFLGALVVIAVGLLLPTFFRGYLPDWYKIRPMKLGLDLRGGSYMVLTVQTDEAVKSHLASVASEIRSELRKNKVGVLRARQVGDRGIEVTLINKDGVAPLDSLVHKDFRGLNRVGVPVGDTSVKVSYELSEAQAQELKKQSVDQAIETVRNRVDGFGVAEASIQRSGAERLIVQLPDVTDLDSVKQTIGSVAKLEFRLVADSTKGSSDSMELPQREGGRIRVEDEVMMSGDAVDRADVDINPQTNQVGVLLKLTSTGAKTFGRITSDNVNRRLAIVLDGVVQSAPNINEPITGGSASITGSFTPQEARLLTVILRSGALPAPLIFAEQRVVGATLGADSIKKGVVATLAGAALVVVFMVVYYRRSGIQAVICTVLNILFMLALLSLFGATLTLPGIAGLALTLGMAVDSNVIIFERIREELKKGANTRAAIDAGFEKAHWTILDANLTTLLTGIILYAFGTGPIKGFAVTLSLGILTTIFAALYISRLGFDLFEPLDKEGRLSI